MSQTLNNHSSQSHTRVINSLLGSTEKKVLLWLAPRMPSWVVPDTLTFLGLFASVLIFLGYALTIYDKGFLWLASFGFILNWFGDSLDGTLARFRKIERPRYGFFVDHIIDSVDEVLVFIGLGLSPFVRFDLACMALIVYMLMSIFVYLGTYVNGVFRISYAGIGPTETRVLAILANTLVFFTNNPMVYLPFVTVTLYDVMVMIIIVLGLVIFTINSISMARDLSKEDREAHRKKIIEERTNRRMERMARQQQLRDERTLRKNTARSFQLGKTESRRRSV
jgi:archaetidylinositol phosphate synthase